MQNSETKRDRRGPKSTRSKVERSVRSDVSATLKGAIRLTIRDTSAKVRGTVIENASALFKDMESETGILIDSPHSV